MIGSGLKKLAREYGMRVDKGVAYGSLGGFNATMFEGAGYKQIVFTTSISDPIKKDAMMNQVNERNLQKEFRVNQLSVATKSVNVVFHDNPGTMGKIRAFLEWFLPLLQNAGATGASICPECGCEVTGGCWKLIGGAAWYMHQSCADIVCREIASEEETRMEDRGGSYVTGMVGALLGSLVGAALWAVVMYIGYVASIVGLAIGWLAEKGYNLLKGKQGKGKIAILIIAVIIGVLLGNFGADVITLISMINNGELPGIVYGDIPLLIMVMLAEEPEYAGATVRYILMGLVFAALGVWGLLRRTNVEVSGTKIADLK